MTFKMVRRSLAATAILAAIAAPSAMACSGGGFSAHAGDGAPSAKTRTHASYEGHHHRDRSTRDRDRDRSTRDCDRGTPPPVVVDPTDPTVPPDPSGGSSF